MTLPPQHGPSSGSERVSTVPFRMYPTPIAVVSGCSWMNFFQAAKLQAEGGSRSIIDQDEKLQSCPISLQRHPACHRILLVALKHLHIGCRHRWNLSAAVPWFHRDDHVHGYFV